jgi:hypothetical protein
MSLEDLPGEVSANIEKAAYRERLKAFLFSRDSGNALTLDSLKAGIHLRTIVSAATEITRCADEVLKIVRNKYSLCGLTPLRPQPRLRPAFLYEHGQIITIDAP